MAAQATRTGAPLSAIVLDLDEFKALNDRHGHLAGDEVLEMVGTTLRHGVRASDFACRWGGEEFVMLLPDTDQEGALQVAETMRASLDGLEVPGVTAHITASLGVATLPDHANDGPSLIRAADRALYAAKAAGRNRVIAAVTARRPSPRAPRGPPWPAAPPGPTGPRGWRRRRRWWRSRRRCRSRAVHPKYTPSWPATIAPGTREVMTPSP